MISLEGGALSTAGDDIDHIAVLGQQNRSCLPCGQKAISISSFTQPQGSHRHSFDAVGRNQPLSDEERVARQPRSSRGKNRMIEPTAGELQAG